MFCRSTDTLGGEVKFDIWEEADLEMEEGGLEHLEGRGDSVDAGLCCDPAIGGQQEDRDTFPQHPLVVRSSKVILGFSKIQMPILVGGCIEAIAE